MIIGKALKTCSSLLILTVVLCLYACTSYSKENTMLNPSNPLKLSLNMTAEMMYGDNNEYLDYQTNDRQPMDTVFRGFNFPSQSKVSATFTYPNGSIDINNIASVRAMGNFSVKNYPLPNINITTFLRGKDSKNITDKEAYEQVNAIFRQLEEQGWEYNMTIDAPRINPKTAVYYAMSGGNASYLDYRYPLSFEQFNQITSYIHRWYLRHGTDTFLEIEMWRNVEDNGDTTILFAYKFHDQLQEIMRFIEVENQSTPLVSFTSRYNNPPFDIRLWDEPKVLAKGFQIDKSLKSHTFPLIKQKTGFDTAKLINTDPYLITNEEFVKRYKSSEDMTPYYENQPEAKPEMTSQIRGRCPAGEPCPKAGYWFTLAKTDSRAYFKQGDIMPDYPNNNWGQVIWQFDGEQG